VGFVGSSAILGETASLAVGSALAHKLKGNESVAFAFFGDAALEEGAFWESVNFAVLYQLPIVFVCENNKLSTESHLSNRTSFGTSFVNKVSGFGMKAHQANGQDIFEVIESAKAGIERVRKNCEPVFLEFQTYRFQEHVGPYFDHQTKKLFRSKEQQLRDQVHDPKSIFKQTLVSAFGISKSKLESIWEVTEREIASIFMKLPSEKEIPDISFAFKDVY
jgi:pyruvate dehydrogenase E1 component alpha subunit